MGKLLERRGPEGTGIWYQNSVGFGHTLLATTPEAVFERLPLRHSETGCVITADVRLDNRADLIASLGLRERAAATGDAEIILLSYLTWGERCVERFLGDFAFAIWDPRKQQCLCARDQFGMRPFYYDLGRRQDFAFASEARAIVALPGRSYALNEERIADFLVNELEGHDTSSTFFQDLLRLPPAHILIVDPNHVRLERYWHLAPQRELRLPSDEAYAEAYLDVFSQAVRRRLRTIGPVGSMLSGGLDLSSIVAIARQELARSGTGPLETFSGVGPDAEACIETRMITAVAGDGRACVAFDQPRSS